MEVGGFHIRVDITRKDVEHDHTRSIFVGNLPFDTEEEPLRQAFNECGEIEGVRIVRDSKTGAGKGFGFILFKERDGVMFALRRNKIEFQGRRLRIFPSAENPHLGQLKSVKKGKPVAYSFSGITSKKATKHHCKGKKHSGGPAKNYAKDNNQSVKSAITQNNGNKKFKSWNTKGTAKVAKSNNTKRNTKGWMT